MTKRRVFIKTAATASAALGWKGVGLLNATCATAESSDSHRLMRRRYGTNGVEISVLGFGGIILMGHEQAECNRLAAAAYESGVDYFDVAPSYGDGEAETKLGPALEPFRENCFLACKTGERTREGAEVELKRSLERLRTDRFDLYQLHVLSDVERDVDAAFAKGGVMELVHEAKKAGQIRHVGFSAHTEEAVLAALDRYDFDSVLFPINFCTLLKNGFGSRVIEATRKKGVTLLALKALARQKWPESAPEKSRFPNTWYQPVLDRETADLALRFALSQPIAAAIPPGVSSLFDLALEIARAFRPITEEETEKLRTLAADLVPIFDL